MRNRFLETRAYLNARHAGSHGLSLPPQRGRISRSLSASQRVLVVLIENGGVDLGVPALVDEVLGQFGSLVPQATRDAMVRAIRRGIRETTDNLLESAELVLNRYQSAAPEHYDRVVVLRNGTALYQNLKNALVQLSQEEKIVDLLILTHGSSESIVVQGGQRIGAQQIRDIRAVHNANRPLHLRSVYMMNCVGSSLNQAWIDAGAKCSAGSIRNNYLPEPTTFFYFQNWKSGLSFNDSVVNAYRSTIQAMKGVLRAAGDTVLPAGLGGQVAVWLADLENRDFVRDSAPVVSGDGTTTIRSDALSFGASLSTSFTVVPLSARSHALQTESERMRASDRVVEFIKSFEEFRANLYNDPVGHCTIGYGTLVHRGNCNGADSERAYQGGISEERALQLLRERVEGFERVVNDAVHRPLNQHQFDALVSFTYNIGSRAFRDSTLLRRLNSGNYEAVPAEIDRWNKANGRVLPGLVRRRGAEGRMFRSADYSTGQNWSAHAMQAGGGAGGVPSGISRIWLWCAGQVAQSALTDPNDAWWARREDLGMTDLVFSLNDHGFPQGRLGLKDRYRGTGTPWAPIARTLEICASKGIAPHLMIFFRPQAAMIREGAEALQAILAQSSVRPRSIHLDLEAWWNQSPQLARTQGEAAVRQYFYDQWTGPRPEMGLGITHVPLDRTTIHGLSNVDFAIPQIYGSARNVGRPVNGSTVERYFRLSAEGLGPNKRLVVGQTANHQYVDPQVMHDLLAHVLDLTHPNIGRVNEVAFWSDGLVLGNPPIKAYFQALCRVARSGSLTAASLPVPGGVPSAQTQWLAAAAPV